MFLFVEYIVEQEEWDRRFGLIIMKIVFFFFFFYKIEILLKPNLNVYLCETPF